MALGGSYQDHHLVMFRDMLDDELQQRGSRLRQTVTSEVMKGQKAHFDKVGRATSYKKTTRNQKKTYQESSFERRPVTFTTLSSDIVLDKVDLMDLIGDPTSDYVRNMIFEHGRQEDDIIIDALGGSVDVVTNGSTSSTALPSGSKIAVNSHLYDSAGGTNDIGLTEFKLKHALKLLQEDEVDVTRETIYCVANANQLSGLKMVTEIVSSDFRSNKSLEGPGIDSISGYLGIVFIQHEDLGTDSNSDELVYVFPQSAVKLGIRQDVQVQIAPDTTLVGNPDTLSVTQSIGATRMYEEKVIQIACDPSTFVSA
jgi:hypothetical protein